MDTLDKSEIDKRRLLYNTKLFNKYLSMKIQKEIKKNENHEMIYQSMKKITVIIHKNINNYIYICIYHNLGSN